MEQDSVHGPDAGIKRMGLWNERVMLEGEGTETGYQKCGRRVMLSSPYELRPCTITNYSLMAFARRLRD